MKTKLALLFALVLAPSTLWSATVEPVEISEDLTVNLSDHKGKTFFELMTEEDGIRAKMNQAFRHPYSILDLEAVQGLEDKFSKKVWSSFLA